MLLDTSGLMSLVDKRAAQHAVASHYYQTARTRLTSSYVLAEFVALTHVRGLSRRETLAFSLELLQDPGVEIVWVAEPLHQQALDLLFARRDKTYSLYDAVSFVLMRERSINEALTTDKHFEQEGFQRLLTP